MTVLMGHSAVDGELNAIAEGACFFGGERHVELVVGFIEDDGLLCMGIEMSEGATEGRSGSPEVVGTECTVVKLHISAVLQVEDGAGGEGMNEGGVVREEKGLGGGLQVTPQSSETE